MKVSRRAVLFVGIPSACAGVYLVATHFLAGRPPEEAKVPDKAAPLNFVVPTVSATQNATAHGTGVVVGASISQPSKTPVKLTNKVVIKVNGMTWLGQTGLLHAIGGSSTMEGSLMAKHGVNVLFERQDDCGVMRDGLVTFAGAMQRGEKDLNGFLHFAIVMGDGTAVFAREWNQLLADKVGKDYAVEIIGMVGRSVGEDKVLGPKSWVDDPQNALGGVICGVELDGDWNIAADYASKHGFRMNPDETTWDPNAINWMHTDTFVEAGNKYISGARSTRRILKAGRLTDDSIKEKEVGCDAVATWTPVDYEVVTKKGGLVTIQSTADNTGQMPATIIGLKNWDAANADLVTEFLAAALEGGEEVLRSEVALRHGTDVSAEVYKYSDWTGATWLKYYHGFDQTDQYGNVVRIGGSTASGMNEAVRFFGLDEADPKEGLLNSPFASTYRRFGHLANLIYPKRVPGFPAIETVVNTTYLQAARAKVANAAPYQAPVFSDTATGKTVADQNWNFNFLTGAAQLATDAKSQAELQKLLDAVQLTSLIIEIHGHTDNQGDPVGNRALSERRAFAVKTWLQAHASRSFSDQRFRIRAHGQDDPLVANDTPVHQAMNRRVEIRLVRPE